LLFAVSKTWLFTDAGTMGSQPMSKPRRSASPWPARRVAPSYFGFQASVGYFLWATSG